jgi:hypothetical protein
MALALSLGIQGQGWHWLEGIEHSNYCDPAMPLILLEEAMVDLLMVPAISTFVGILNPLASMLMASSPMSSLACKRAVPAEIAASALQHVRINGRWILAWLASINDLAGQLADLQASSSSKTKQKSS